MSFHWNIILATFVWLECWQLKCISHDRQGWNKIHVSTLKCQLLIIIFFIIVAFCYILLLFKGNRAFLSGDIDTDSDAQHWNIHPCVYRGICSCLTPSVSIKRSGNPHTAYAWSTPVPWCESEWGCISLRGKGVVGSCLWVLLSIASNSDGLSMMICNYRLTRCTGWVTI